MPGERAAVLGREPHQQSAHSKGIRSYAGDTLDYDARRTRLYGERGSGNGSDLETGNDP
jgi:hypothetical protein